MLLVAMGYWLPSELLHIDPEDELWEKPHLTWATDSHGQLFYIACGGARFMTIP